MKYKIRTSRGDCDDVFRNKGVHIGEDILVEWIDELDKGVMTITVDKPFVIKDGWVEKM